LCSLFFFFLHFILSLIFCVFLHGIMVTFLWHLTSVFFYCFPSIVSYLVFSPMISYLFHTFFQVSNVPYQLIKSLEPKFSNLPKSIPSELLRTSMCHLKSCQLINYAPTHLHLPLAFLQIASQLISSVFCLPAASSQISWLHPQLIHNTFNLTQHHNALLIHSKCLI
jgi:hypothetical protein